MSELEKLVKKIVRSLKLRSNNRVLGDFEIKECDEQLKKDTGKDYYVAIRILQDKIAHSSITYYHFLSKREEKKLRNADEI